MSEVRWEHYGKQPRFSEQDRVAGLGMIRLLVPGYRESEFRRLAERDRRYLMADLKWTAAKLQRLHVCKGRPATVHQ